MALQMSTVGLQWDDLRYVLAVGRHGTLSAAARSLQVNHSTVFRRIGQLEHRLGVRLFDRHHDGYTPTSAAVAAITLAERMESEVGHLERRLAGQDTQPSGTVRVTTTDTLLEGALGPMFSAFRSAYPEITLEVVVENRFLSLSKRDADVALRPTQQPPGALVGRRACGLATAIYGSTSYLAAAPSPDAPDRHDWVAPDDSLAHLPSARWLDTRVGPAKVVARANTLLGLLTLAKAGMGLAPLPCFLGHTTADLHRVCPPIAELSTDLWVLAHPDLRRVPRIRVFLDFLNRELRGNRRLFEGQGPGSRAERDSDDSIPA